MKAFLDEFYNLVLVVDKETPDDLPEVNTLEEVVATYLPKLLKVEPELIGAKTNQPIFNHDQSFWTFPEYLTVDPMELLRDTGKLLLTRV